MADKEYYGSVQFQPIAQQREHDDRFVKELIMTGSELDIDFSEFMREDIMIGNTATLRKFEKANDIASFTVAAVDGSTDGRIGVTKEIIQDFYPMIPLKDDESGPDGYVALPDDNQRKIDVEKALGYLDLDLTDLSDAVLTPAEIPDVGSSDWTSDYGKTWKDSPSLQEEFGTEQAWHDSLVEARATQLESIGDITDIHVGLHATAGTLDEANIIAVYEEFTKLLPQLTYRGFEDADIPDFPVQTYLFQVNSGYWLTVNGMRGWTHIIRNGIVENKFDTPENIDLYNKKSTVNFYYGDAYIKDDTDGDPINTIMRSDPAWNEKMHLGGVPGDSKAMMELQVQLTRGDNPTYGEIRVWNYETAHVITNDQDTRNTLILGNLGGKVDGLTEGPDIGEEFQASTINFNELLVGTYGTNDIDIAWSIADMYAGDMFNIGVMSGEVNFNNPPIGGTYYLKLVAVGNGPEDTGAQSVIYLTVTVLNEDGSEPPTGTPPWTEEDEIIHEPGSEEYVDICYFPIGRKSTKEVPIFKRERLIRESVILGIYVVKIVKLKWYQSRWFSIVMFVVALIFSFVGGGGLLVVLQSVLIKTVIGLAISIIVKVLATFIDNPFLIAIAVVAAMAVTGYINIDMQSILSTVDMAMNVTNTAIKEVMVNKMEELEAQMKEFNEMANNLQEEQDKMMEEVGLMRLDAWEYLKQMLVVPDAEMPTHALDRTTDVDGSLITSLDSSVDVHNLWNSMITQN